MPTPTADRLRTFYASRYLAADGNALNQYTLDSGTVRTLRDAALTEASGYWDGAVGWFDANTATAALRGAVFHVQSFDGGTDTLTLSRDLPAAPQAGDTFRLALGGNRRSSQETFGMVVGGTMPEFTPVACQNIAGLTIRKASARLGANDVYLSYDATRHEVTVKIGASGSPGPALSVAADVTGAAIHAADDQGYVIVDVVAASLPTSNAQQVFTLAYPRGYFCPDFEGYETGGQGKIRFRLEVCRNTDPADTMVDLCVHTVSPGGLATTIAAGQSLTPAAGTIDIVGGADSATPNTLDERPAATITAAQAKRSGMVGRRVRLFGSVSEWTDTECRVVDAGTADVVVLTLQGAGEHASVPVRLVGGALIDRWEGIQYEASIFEVRGEVAQELKESGRNKVALGYFVEAEGIDPCDGALAILRATPEEVEQARATLRELAAAGRSALDHIVSELREIIGIVGLEDHRALAEALAVMVMQAVSDGWTTNPSCSGRIHTLVIGRPASGKKLLSQAAQILNPAYEEVGKALSAAGLVGFPSIGAGGKWRCTPGALPRASRGVVAVEDYHELSRALRREFEMHASKVMEDGYVYNSKAGNRRYAALTAIHIDSNLPSQVEIGRSSPLDDGSILPPRNVLSRIDYIAVMDEDSDANIKVGAALIRNQATSAAGDDEAKARRTRALRVLVAVLKENYSGLSYDLGTPTTEQLVEAYREITGDGGSEGGEGGWVNSFAPRISIHLRRLVKASATLHLRACSSEDVDAASALVAGTMVALRRFLAPSEKSSMAVIDDAVWLALSGRSGVAPQDVCSWLVDSGSDTTSTGEARRNKANRILVRLTKKGVAKRMRHGLYGIDPHPAARQPGEGGARAPVDSAAQPVPPKIHHGREPGHGSPPPRPVAVPGTVARRKPIVVDENDETYLRYKKMFDDAIKGVKDTPPVQHGEAEQARDRAKGGGPVRSGGGQGSPSASGG